MLHPKTQEPLDHMSQNGIIEHSICSDYILSHNGNVASDQVECLEDDNIEYPLEDVDGQFSLKEDDLVSTWKEEYEPLSSEFQPNQLEENLMEEEVNAGT